MQPAAARLRTVDPTEAGAPFVVLADRKRWRTDADRGRRLRRTRAGRRGMAGRRRRGDCRRRRRRVTRPARTAARSARRRPRLGAARARRAAGGGRDPRSIAIPSTRTPRTPSSPCGRRSMRAPTRSTCSARPAAIGSTTSWRISCCSPIRPSPASSCGRSSGSTVVRAVRGGRRLALRGDVGDLVTLLPIGGDANGRHDHRSSLAARRGDAADGPLARPLERGRRPRRIGHAHRRGPPRRRNRINGRAPMTTAHLATATAAGARSTSSSPRSIAVAFGVAFLAWNALAAATTPAFAFFPPARASSTACGCCRRSSSADRAAPGRRLLRRLRCRGGLRRPWLAMGPALISGSPRVPARSSGSRSGCIGAGTCHSRCSRAPSPAWRPRPRPGGVLP